MKNSLITYLLGFFVLASCFNASAALLPDIDTSLCLQIEGVVLNAGDDLDENCTIELLCANKLIRSLVLMDGNKSFKFTLKKNLSYAIRISQKNRVSKLISIDTKMNKDPYGMKYFLFETKLKATYDPAKNQPGYVNSPIAIIYYDSSKDDFVHDKEYANKMKNELVLK